MENNSVMHEPIVTKAPHALHPSTLGNDKLDSRLILVNRYIRNYYAEPITLESLSALIDCNPVYLSNTYSKVFKVPPIQYLQKVRMHKSRHYLTHTNLTVSEIALKVGYYTASQFGALFKKHFNLTPNEYRMHDMMLRAAENRFGVDGTECHE